MSLLVIVNQEKAPLVYAVNRRAEMVVIWLQIQLDVYVVYTDKWRVSINLAKSTNVIFSRCTKLSYRQYVSDTRRLCPPGVM